MIEDWLSSVRWPIRDTIQSLGMYCIPQRWIDEKDYYRRLK